MRTNGDRVVGRLAAAAASVTLLALCLLGPRAAAARQWATASNNTDISNSNSGNVGVGTGATTPVEKLTVNGKISVNRTGSPGAAELRVYNGGSVAEWAFRQAGASSHNLNISKAVSGVYSDFFTIGTTGNVGVGTANPTSKLHVVSGTANGTTLLHLDTGVLTGGTAMGVGATANNESYFDMSVYRTGQYYSRLGVTNFGNVYLQPGGGNVGLGTTAPAQRLQIGGNTPTLTATPDAISLGATYSSDPRANPKLRLYDDNAGSVYGMGASDHQFDFMTPATTRYVWSVGGAEKMRLDASGNLGIGTSAPNTAKLVIAGSAGATGIDLAGSDVYAEMRVIRNSVGASDKDLYLQYQAGANSKTHIYSSNAETVTVSGGKVGIGNNNPTEALDVVGNITATGNIAAKYQDLAEWVPSTQRLSAGTVVVLDTGKTNHVLASTKAYDTGVAGVISDSPGVILGVGGDDKLKVATTGRVKVKVDATRAPIKVGDLLVTSDAEGVAMKSVEVDLGGVKLHRPGTIIGKALEPLASGTGEILVLLSLQ